MKYSSGKKGSKKLIDFHYYDYVVYNVSNKFVFPKRGGENNTIKLLFYLFNLAEYSRSDYILIDTETFLKCIRYD